MKFPQAVLVLYCWMLMFESIARLGYVNAGPVSVLKPKYRGNTAYLY